MKAQALLGKPFTLAFSIRIFLVLIFRVASFFSRQTLFLFFFDFYLTFCFAFISCRCLPVQVELFLLVGSFFLFVCSLVFSFFFDEKSIHTYLFFCASVPLSADLFLSSRSYVYLAASSSAAVVAHHSRCTENIREEGSIHPGYRFSSLFFYSYISLLLFFGIYKDN